ncbi:MAG: polysaccharide deacetylase family protein [Pseudomonadota bacterium]|nr:polysaccharide deacetylase family protein [Pseudomonadota bacterium]
MQLDWTPVRQELARWHNEELTLPVWWRDDDAIEPTQQLEKLLELSAETGVPVHLAIIPREATKALAERIIGDANVVPVVHGWSHTNYQPKTETKCEFGNARPLEIRSEQAAEGLRRLQTLLGERVSAMFVPPWNRVPADFFPELGKIGFHSVSTCNPRASQELVPGLAQINTHIDPLYWRPSKKLSHPELIVEKTARLLKKRRQGKLDNTEPFGLLTHHLAHDDRAWEFCRQFWSELLEGPFEVFRSA